MSCDNDYYCHLLLKKVACHENRTCDRLYNSERPKHLSQLCGYCSTAQVVSGPRNRYGCSAVNTALKSATRVGPVLFATTVQFIKAVGLSQVGHVEQMPKKCVPKKIIKAKMSGMRKRVCSRSRWTDEAEDIMRGIKKQQENFYCFKSKTFFLFKVNYKLSKYSPSEATHWFQHSIHFPKDSEKPLFDILFSIPVIALFSSASV